MVAVSAADGIALFVIVLLLRAQIVPPPNPGPELRLNRITCEETAQDPPRVPVTARFDGFQVGPGSRVLLAVFKDAECREVIATERVDDPNDGTMLVFLRGTRESVKAARLGARERLHAQTTNR